MPVGEICNREVVIVQPHDTALEAAILMRQHHVGNVLVVEDRGGMSVPVGIVTDRDLVIEIMAPQLDATAITVGDLMTSELSTVKESSGIFETIELMRTRGVRRMPVVNDSGALIGIVTLDDLLELLAEELLSLAKLVPQEQKKESTSRR